MKNNLIDIILPTWNNQQYLMPNLQSVLRARVSENLFHIYVINNGHPDSCNWIQSPYITVLQPGKNLGWEGGLKLGLENSSAPFVVFYNDDTHIPQSSRLWLQQMIQHFKEPEVGAVGPSSNVVMGLQNIFADVPVHQFAAKFLIGFCMMVRRSALEKAGGVDDTLPGGDDLDLSIRLRDAGYKLIVDRDVFVYHHGFKTGVRLHGDHTKKGGWNALDSQEKTNFALIRKHGFRKWYEVIMGTWQMPENFYTYNIEDAEGNIIRKFADGRVILDLGCGNKKTLPNAIGVDMIEKNEVIDTLGKNTKSAADITADVSEPLPVCPQSVDTIIARHILEHMVDPITTIKNWKESLKLGGKLIIAVPDESRHLTIPMNIEHKSCYTPLSMQALLVTLGMKVLNQMDGENNVSFITIAQK